MVKLQPQVYKALKAIAEGSSMLKGLTLEKLEAAATEYQELIEKYETKNKELILEFDRNKAQLEFDAKHNKTELFSTLANELKMSVISKAEVNELREELVEAEIKFDTEVSKIKTEADKTKNAAISAATNKAKSDFQLATAKQEAQLEQSLNTISTLRNTIERLEEQLTEANKNMVLIAQSNSATVNVSGK